MEEQNNNSNNVENNANNNSTQNGQYTFFNMKDDHGFNDNITSKVEDPKKRASGRIVFILAMIIVGISAAMLIRGIATSKMENTYYQNSNYQNTHNSFVETRNKILDTRNRIMEQRNQIKNLNQDR